MEYGGRLSERCPRHAGQNEPDSNPSDAWVDWDITHEFADGSVKAGDIASARRDFREGRIDIFEYDQALANVLLRHERYTGKHADAERKRSEDQAKPPSRMTVLPEGARYQAFPLTQQAYEDEAVARVNQAMAVAQALDAKPTRREVYVTRWTLDGYEMKIPAHEIEYAVKCDDGTWHYQMREPMANIGPVLREKPVLPEEIDVAEMYLNALGKQSARQRHATQREESRRRKARVDALFGGKLSERV
jgi:hypothetical protein